jgi:hypothetical protein
MSVCGWGLLSGLRVSFPPSHFSFSIDIFFSFFSRLASELHERFVERDGC